MYVLVVEQASLWEFPLATAQPEAGSGSVASGPWSPAECSRQLLEWFDAGLIELYADTDGDGPEPSTQEEWQLRVRTLAPTAVRDVLAHPERWTVESDDGHVCVCQTDAGEDPDAEWW